MEKVNYGEYYGQEHFEEGVKKSKFKKRMKRIGAVIGVGAVGVVGYKLGHTVGERMTELKNSWFIAKVLNDHPDVKEPFMKAAQDTIEKFDSQK